MNTHPRNRRAASRSLLVLAMTAVIAPDSSGAELPLPAAPDEDFAGLPALTADELQALRGGFEIAGLKFDFAAELRTFVDGRLALETLVTYTKTGTATQHRPLPLPEAVTGITATGSPLESTADTAAANPADPETSVQLLGPGQSRTPAQLTLPGVDLSGLKDATGILINDRKGAILALHEATRERITSMVVNQASGRDIRQELNVSVTVQNFQQFRDSLRSTLLNGRLSNTMSR